MLCCWSLLRGIQKLGVDSPVVRYIRAGVVASCERNRSSLALVSYESGEELLQDSALPNIGGADVDRC